MTYLRRKGRVISFSAFCVSGIMVLGCWISGFQVQGLYAAGKKCVSVLLL